MIHTNTVIYGLGGPNDLRAEKRTFQLSFDGQGPTARSNYRYWISIVLDPHDRCTDTGVRDEQRETYVRANIEFWFLITLSALQSSKRFQITPIDDGL